MWYNFCIATGVGRQEGGVMRKTKIVCTMGPKEADDEEIAAPKKTFSASDIEF